MKPEVEQILKMFKRNINRIIKFEHHFSFRQNDPWTEYIGLVKDIDMRHGYIYIGHPYRTSDKSSVAGEMGIHFGDDFIDGKNVHIVTEEEFNTWKDLYNKFHTEIMVIKNCDVCEEDLKTIKY